MKKYLLAGMLAWAPLGITIWVLLWLLGSMDGLFGALLVATQAVLPPSTHTAIGQLRDIPGLGVVVVVVILLLTGVFVTNVVGQWIARR